MRNAVLGFSSFVVLALAGGCGGGGGGTTSPPGPLASVTIGGSSTVVVNGTTQLSVTGKDAQRHNIDRSAGSHVELVEHRDRNGRREYGHGYGSRRWIGKHHRNHQRNRQRPKSDDGVGAATTATVAATTSLDFNPNQVDITAGGTVTWQFSTTTHNVTFNSTATGTPANIPDQTGTNVSRTFTTAGTFPYHCTLHAGMNGAVVGH
jgi:Plastocyanin